MFNVYGDGVFLDMVADNSPATLAQFHALGYDNVEARHVVDLIEGDGVKEAEGYKPAKSAPAAEWPKWMEDPAFLEEGKEMEALKAHGQAEIDMDAPDPETEEAEA